MTPLLLPRAPAHLGIVGPPQSGASFVAQAVLAANPGVKVVLKDFSQRPGVLAANDPWIVEASALAEREHCVVISVLHSGGSGRELPDAKRFFEIWRISAGWPTQIDGRPWPYQNGSEVTLDRGGNRPLLRMRTNDGFHTYQIEEETSNV